MAIAPDNLGRALPIDAGRHEIQAIDFENYQHPRTAEGVLFPDWLIHDTVVVDVKPYRKPEPNEFGTFFFDQYEMSDGTAYRLMQGQPNRQKTEVPIDGTTAWGTQPEGHNALTDKELMKLGYPTRRIGAEWFPDIQVFNARDLLAAIKKGLGVSLGYSAHNMLEILEASDEQNRHTITSSVSLTTGESRDPMIEPGLNALGRVREIPRIIAHADSVDPCVPTDVRHWKPFKLARTLISEAEAVARTGLHVITSPDRLEYVRTLDFSPSSVVPAITLANALLTGQAGELAQLRPKDSPMHLSFMRRSHGNDHEEFEDIYATHPLVHVVLRNGAHMDIPRTRRGVVRRHSLILDQLLQNGDNPLDLDLEKVYELPKRRGRGLLHLLD